jgi:hypothetical protein
MNLQHKLSLCIALSTASLLLGCYEQPDVTLHQPGALQGDQEHSLLAQPRTSGLEKRLHERMLTVQTDR